MSVDFDEGLAVCSGVPLWNRDSIALLRELRRAGKSTKVIAEALQKSETEIRRQLAYLARFEL